MYQIVPSFTEFFVRFKLEHESFLVLKFVFFRGHFFKFQHFSIQFSVLYPVYPSLNWYLLRYFRWRNSIMEPPLGFLEIFNGVLDFYRFFRLNARRSLTGWMKCFSFSSLRTEFYVFFSPPPASHGGNRCRAPRHSSSRVFYLDFLKNIYFSRRLPLSVARLLLWDVKWGHRSIKKKGKTEDRTKKKLKENEEEKEDSGDRRVGRSFGRWNLWNVFVPKRVDEFLFSSWRKIAAVLTDFCQLGEKERRVSVSFPVVILSFFLKTR